MGTAYIASSNRRLISPSYSTTPPANRFPPASLSLRSPRKSAPRDSGTGFDLDSRQRAHPALDHEVHLETVPVPEVGKGQCLIAPARLTFQLLEDEGLQQLAKPDPIGPEVIGTNAQHRARQAGLTEMQFRCLHQPGQAVAVSRWKFLQKAHTGQERDCGQWRSSARQQVGHMLDLVEDHPPWQVVHEPDRIVNSCTAHGRIVARPLFPIKTILALWEIQQACDFIGKESSGPS